jgi:hypothetical protein
MNQDLHLRTVPLALTLALLLVLFPAAQAQDLQVVATVSADTVGVQDQFELTVTVTGSDSGEAQTPRMPRLQGLRVVAGPSLSTQFQWINGRSSSSRSFIYTLLPEREGQFTIDPIEVTIGSKVYRTQPITMRVTSASHAAAPPTRTAPANPIDQNLFGGMQRAQPSGDEVYVTAELDRTSAYPGQQVTLTYHLYTHIGVSGLQLQENPPLTGFWVENIEVESKPTGTRRLINGREYLDYLVKKQALFANTPGRQTIPSSTFAVSVKSESDFFGIFGQTETVYRKTKEIALDVKPLPTEDRPAGFNNAIGSFSLSDELNKTEVAAGDAVSLRVTLTGKGNLTEIADIPLPSMPDLEIYSSKHEDNVHPVAGDQIGGDKVWEYVIVPKAAGSHTIPALSFPYFDPERGGYETATAPPISLNVTPGNNAGNAIALLSGINKQSLTRQGTDIDFIKLSGEALEPQPRPVYYWPWFYLLAIVSLLTNAGAFLVQRERARQSGDVALARSRRAKRLALGRLRSAEKAGRQEPRLFYDEAALAFAGYLEDRFNLPEIAVTTDTLERAMEERSIAAETMKEAVAILQECDFGRFVSASSVSERRRALAGRIRRIIDALERVRT